ncbi:hypothetical protein QO009_003823 [Brevibacillus aydinogluensis]|nr:hypothetical protein [Brevibacillus aydinogluensis]
MMEELVVWLLAAYGCSSLLVTLANRWISRMAVRADQSCVHYRLLLGNSEQVLEYAVRRLHARSYWSGTPIRISYVDYGSTDDTCGITAVLKRAGCLCADEEEEVADAPAVIVDLRHTDEWERVI